jgi:hypothetical protein
MGAPLELALGLSKGPPPSSLFLSSRALDPLGAG